MPEVTIKGRKNLGQVSISDFKRGSFFLSLRGILSFKRCNNANPLTLAPAHFTRKNRQTATPFSPPPFRRKGRGYFLTLLNAFLCPAALDWLFYSSNTKLQPSVCAKEEEEEVL